MQKNCHQCSVAFEVTNEDLALLDKLSPMVAEKKFDLPLPTLCPLCRQQRRWALRNENHLYRRTCDLTGAPMISLYPPDSPHRVFNEDAYRSNGWNPMDSGRPYDFSRPFFDQFGELLLAVPRRGMQLNGTSENCDYTTYGGWNKNCYMTFTCFYCVDAFHSTRLAQVKDSSDCLLCVKSELLYECINCTGCYRCFYSNDSNNCQDSILLDHCQACRNCIMCKNLRNKEYHVRNRPVTPQEFAAARDAFLKGDPEEERKEFDAWKLSLPFPHAHLMQSEGCTGDYLFSAKNCRNCFELHMGAEDCRYCQVCGMGAKDAMDCIMFGEGSLCYETVGTGPAQRCAFVSFAGDVEQCLYCVDFHHSAHCFGCVGIDRKQYCIFNRQYSKEEYEELVPRIVVHMQSTGEWGEFFPMRLSPFAYNDTIAHERFPLTEEEVRKQGLRWREEGQAEEAGSPETAEGAAVCSVTGKSFRITKQERSLLEQLGISLPHVHPAERHRRRLARSKPHRLWKRPCGKCGKEIETAYAPERPEIVYCENCYLKEVY